MAIFASVIFVIVCILLVVVILLQKGRGGGLGAAFGGAASSAFGTRVGDVFTWVTIVLTAVFLLLAIGMVAICRPTPGIVAKPYFAPPPSASGDYGKSLYVNIFCATPEAEIYYTIDGPTPSENGQESQLYGSPVRIKTGQTLRAKAFRSGGWKESPLAEAYYGPPKPAAVSQTMPATLPATRAAPVPGNVPIPTPAM